MDLTEKIPGGELHDNGRPRGLGGPMNDLRECGRSGGNGSGFSDGGNFATVCLLTTNSPRAMRLSRQRHDGTPGDAPRIETLPVCCAMRSSAIQSSTFNGTPSRRHGFKVFMAPF